MVTEDHRERPEFGTPARRRVCEWLGGGFRRETAIIIRRQQPLPDSQFYCLTSEGPKALHDNGIASLLISEEEICIQYRPGAEWADPVTDRGRLHSRIRHARGTGLQPAA